MDSVSNQLIPRFAEGYSVHQTEAEAWLQLPDGTKSVVPAAVVLLVDLCDGQRNRGEVLQALVATDGAGLAWDAAWGLLEELGGMGALEFSARRSHVEIFGEPRHSCLGCGRSCEGWTVGPLSDEEVERIAAAHAELAQHEPRVAAHAPFEDVEDGARTIRALSFPDGRCLFLDAQRRCLLHARFGPDTKPEICKRFPVSSIIVEDATRVGVRPVCYRHHRSYRDGDEVDLVTYGTNPASVRAVNAHAERYADEDVYRSMLYAEADILDRLREPAMTLAEHVHRLAGAEASDPPRNALPVAAIAQLQRRLAELRSHSARLFDASGSHHAAASIRLLDALAELGALAPDDLAPLTLPSRWRHYAFHLFGQAVFLREIAMFPSVTAGAMVQAIGALAAAWAIRVQTGDLLDDDERFDTFAEHLAAWMRLVNEQRMLTLFADHDAYESFLRPLRTGED